MFSFGEGLSLVVKLPEARTDRVDLAAVSSLGNSETNTAPYRPWSSTTPKFVLGGFLDWIESRTLFFNLCNPLLGVTDQRYKVRNNRVPSFSEAKHITSFRMQTSRLGRVLELDE